jgi:hypothetical protein
MDQFPAALRRYLLVAWFIGIAVWAASWFWRFGSRPISWPVAGMLAGLLLLAQCFHKHTLRGVKITPSSVPLFAAVLCLPMYAAISAVVVGMVVAEVLSRRPWYEVAFNGASSAVEVALGSIVYVGLVSGGRLGIVISAAVASGVLIYLTNAALVAGAVATQRGLSYRQVWQETIFARVAEHALMLLAGGLLAAVLTWQPLSGGVLLVMALVAYAWLRRRVYYALPYSGQAAS